MYTTMAKLDEQIPALLLAPQSGALRISAYKYGDHFQEQMIAQIKLTYCCMYADWIDILCVNLAKTLKIGTLKY